VGDDEEAEVDRATAGDGQMKPVGQDTRQRQNDVKSVESENRLLQPHPDIPESKAQSISDCMKPALDKPPTMAAIRAQPFPALIVLNHIADVSDVSSEKMSAPELYFGNRRIIRTSFLQSNGTWVHPPANLTETDPIYAPRRTPSLDCPHCGCNTHVRYSVYARISNEAVNRDTALKRNLTTYILTHQIENLIWPSVALFMLFFVFCYVGGLAAWKGLSLYLIATLLLQLAVIHVRRAMIHKAIGKRPTLLMIPDLLWPATSILENKAANPAICISTVSTEHDQEKGWYGHEVAMCNGHDRPGERLTERQTLHIGPEAYDNFGLTDPYIPAITESWGRYATRALSLIYPELRATRP
jgi:hypothetical protein